MAERINNTDVIRIAATVSDGMPVDLVVGRRNGYTALDLYRNGAWVDTLTTGTSREVYTYLQGMRRAQILRYG